MKTPLHNFGAAPYKSLGCPDPGVKSLPEPWNYYGMPLRKPLPAPPPRPDVGEGEFESFPFAVTYVDGSVPEFCGLPSGSFDVGGEQGWIPFSKGSLTGDPSWAGWPVDRWSNAEAHDIVFDFKDKYYIRRIDIQQINSGVRNLEIQVRGAANPAEIFASVYRFNGPGTERGLETAIPVYFSNSGIDSVAQQLRLSLGNAGKWGNGAAVSSSKPGPRQLPGRTVRNCRGLDLGGAQRRARRTMKSRCSEPFIPAEQPPIKFVSNCRSCPEPVIWPRLLVGSFVQGDVRSNLKGATTIVCANMGQLPELAQWFKAEIKDRFCTDLSAC